MRNSLKIKILEDLELNGEVEFSLIGKSLVVGKLPSDLMEPDYKGYRRTKWHSHKDMWVFGDGWISNKYAIDFGQCNDDSTFMVTHYKISIGDKHVISSLTQPLMVFGGVMPEFAPGTLDITIGKHLFR